MQPETLQQSKPQAGSLGDKIWHIGKTLAELDPGALASLRRHSSDGIGAPMFWLLRNRHDLHPEPAWSRIIQLMAILTDKGDDPNKVSPHDHKHRLGAALCDGGNAELTWAGGVQKPRPMLSELRFARLLAAKGETRLDLLERAVRMLAAKKLRGAGVNCEDLAWFVLLGDDAKPAQKLARNYYARLDRAQRADGEPQGTDTVPGDDE